MQPHIGLRGQQVGFLQVYGHRGIARVLFVDVIASGIFDHSGDIAFGRGHEPAVAVRGVEHHRRGIENIVRYFLSQDIVSDGDFREYFFALRPFSDDLRKCQQPFGFAQRRFFEVIADVHERNIQFFELALHRACPVHAVEQHEVRVEREQQFVVDIPFVAYISNAVPPCLNVGIGDVVDA